jgi:hypothetical protein
VKLKILLRCSETPVSFYQTTWHNIPQEGMDYSKTLSAADYTAFNNRGRLLNYERDGNVGTE